LLRFFKSKFESYVKVVAKNYYLEYKIKEMEEEWKDYCIIVRLVTRMFKTLMET
jgi:hypothetical protein